MTRDGFGRASVPRCAAAGGSGKASVPGRAATGGSGRGASRSTCRRGRCLLFTGQKVVIAAQTGAIKSLELLHIEFGGRPQGAPPARSAVLQLSIPT